MRPRVGKAHLHTGFGGQLLEHLGPVVGDGGAPAQGTSVLEHQIQEGVDGVNAAALLTDLTERLADH